MRESEQGQHNLIVQAWNVPFIRGVISPRGSEKEKWFQDILERSNGNAVNVIL